MKKGVKYYQNIAELKNRLSHLKELLRANEITLEEYRAQVRAILTELQGSVSECDDTAFTAVLNAYIHNTKLSLA